MTNQQNNNLFDLKNSFYLGNWQQCLNEAQSIKVCFDKFLKIQINRILINLSFLSNDSLSTMNSD